MKKDLLFIMNDLRCGGAEKSLVSLLQTIDYSLYNVDLYLFKKEGLFLNQVPKEVTILSQPEYYPYFDMSITKALVTNLKKGNFKVVWCRLMTGLIFKTEKIPAVREQKVWNYLKNVILPLPKKYDIAIGYLEKTPNYFCVDKVSATKKVGFIHNDYISLKMDKAIDLPFFQKLNHIFTVSESCKSILRETFPAMKGKFKVMYNIVSPKTIKLLANEKITIDTSFKTIITVGRLNKQKGYELAVEACSILKKRGIVVKWYILGEGEERNNLEKLIRKFDVGENFILLGIIENPYPYVKQADVYVQTSRFEGKSIAIDEAKILNKPIVVTNFETVFDQIENEVNGLIVSMNPHDIAIAIQKVIEDSVIQNRFIANLEKEKKGNEDEIEKLYKLLNS